MADTQPLSQDASNLSSSLGVDLNKLPGFLKQEATARKAASDADIQAKSLEESVGFEQKRKALEGISSEDKAHYEDVKKQMMPTPEFKPTQDNAADIGGLFSMIATMGVALGGSGKLSGLNAMNAMGGMLKGYQQGRKDLFTKEQATFDKELASMKAHNDELIKDLEQYNKLRVTDKEAALLKAGEITAKYPGVIAAKINAGDTKVAADIAHSNSEMLMKMDEARTRLGLAGKGVEKEVKPLIQGVRSINYLEKQLDDPEIQVGLQSKAAPLLQKLTSLGNGSKDFETVVNNELTGNDKTTLFLKNALLETYAIERAAKNGQRLSVQDMKMIGPVLDPTNYKPETYRAVLEDRRRTLFNNLQDSGLSEKEINQRAAEHPYTPYGSTQQTSPQSNEPKRSVSGDELKQYASTHNMSEEDAKTFLTSKGYSFK